MKRNPTTDLALVSLVDWARLAAYIDGEGHICIAESVHREPHDGRGRYGFAKVTVSNTDSRLTDWLLKTFGGNVQVRSADSASSGRRKRWKTCFNWTTSNGRAADILRFCLPYFIVKREQAELAISYQATCVRCGVKGTPQGVIERREVIKTQLRAFTARGLKAVNE